MLLNGRSLPVINRAVTGGIGTRRRAARYRNRTPRVGTYERDPSTVGDGQGLFPYGRSALGEPVEARRGTSDGGGIIGAFLDRFET